MTFNQQRFTSPLNLEFMYLRLDRESEVKYMTRVCPDVQL